MVYGDYDGRTSPTRERKVEASTVLAASALRLAGTTTVPTPGTATTAESRSSSIPSITVIGR